MAEVNPTPSPPTMRKITNTQILDARPVNRALNTNSAAASCMTRTRPMRSASVPANHAPTTQPIMALDTEKPLMAAFNPKPESGLAMASTAPLMTEVS